MIKTRDGATAYVGMKVFDLDGIYQVIAIGKEIVELQELYLDNYSILYNISKYRYLLSSEFHNKMMVY